jgi:serine O-acetyltransferase
MKRKDYKEIIKADLFRYFGDTSYKKFLFCYIFIPGFKYTYFLRKCQYHKNKRSRALQYYYFLIFLKRYMVKYGYEISDNVKIGKGFYIGHLGGIAINPDAIIGCNVNIAKGVTIGETIRGKNRGIPEIGNKTWIGSNAIIVGSIKIGNNVLIAPGSYVNFDVPDNSVVIGNPGKITNSKDGANGYIINTVD